ncbi:MAG: spore coat protein CotH [Ruminiclostridium sp.]|jgi:hypothetical protein|nr:spore coat protein CotH [Ruminiclostridium sp.]
MATNKHIDKLCLIAALLALLLALGFLYGKQQGPSGGGKTMGYEARLFDTTTVHTIDLQMEDWEDFIASCEDETYHPCTVVIDGEAYANIGIRAKGNTSLRNVSAMGSQRYSFKLEFDQYDSGLHYYGLDKLCLNNIIQDNSYMKDFLTYQLMGQFGVAAPLCSYAYITVNGQDWGLYLAVEGVEEGFLQRNYGNDYGELYKPDSMDMDGSQGRGMQAFDQESGGVDPNNIRPPERPANDAAPAQLLQEGPGGGFGGSNDVKLQYIDDDPDSYPNLFDNAKTDVSQTDQARLIAALKSLSQGERLEEVVDVEGVLRYFVVHNFVVNGDSYTGSMVHNYYLYEKDGQLSMLPWDYNLAFGTFTGGEATAQVNDPIDEVLEDRPMQAWIFSDAAYTQWYHALYADFLEAVDIDGLIQETAQRIAPYVERDPTKFCTDEEFEAGVEALRNFCTLRAQSIQGQLEGTVPATTQGQAEAPEALLSAGELSLAAMGTMSGGMGGGPGGGWGRPTDGQPSSSEAALPAEDGAPTPAEETLPTAEGESPPIAGQSPAASGQAGSPAAQEPEHQPDRAAGAWGMPGDGRPATQEAPTASTTTWVLLGASVAVLILGLVVAFRVKR